MSRPSAILANAVSNALKAEGSTRPLGLFRICLGTLVYMRFGQELSLHAANSVPEMLFSLVFFASAAAVTVGLFTRASLAVTALCLGAMYYGNLFGWWYPGWGHHHHYLLMICCAVLAFSAAGRSFSLDRILAVSKAERTGEPAPEERSATWPQTLLVLQLCAIYFWAAFDKTTGAFLRGDWLERVIEWVYGGHVAYDWVTSPVFLIGGSVVVLIVEYALPIYILLRQRLEIVVPVALALHAGFYVMLPVQTYSATMIALYLLVVNPDWLDRQLDRFFGKQAAHG